ncbi:hypothetical protein MRY87_00515 [bacterium]|nr:hypothetical protein [bacterium]
MRKVVDFWRAASLSFFVILFFAGGASASPDTDITLAEKIVAEEFAMIADSIDGGEGAEGLCECSMEAMEEAILGEGSGSYMGRVFYECKDFFGRVFASGATRILHVCTLDIEQWCGEKMEEVETKFKEAHPLHALGCSYRCEAIDNCTGEEYRFGGDF